MEWTEAAAGRPSLAAEFGRMNAELTRLRAIVREHGIDPGDEAAVNYPASLSGPTRHHGLDPGRAVRSVMQATSCRL